MTSKAQIERLTQLALASQGKETKRPLKEILASEKLAAARYIPRSAKITTGQQPVEEREA